MHFFLGIVLQSKRLSPESSRKRNASFIAVEIKVDLTSVQLRPVFHSFAYQVRNCDGVQFLFLLRFLTELSMRFFFITTICHVTYTAILLQGFHQVLIKPVACSDHWRKNISELGQTCRAYAIDLLGYGYSDKPDPRSPPPLPFQYSPRQIYEILSVISHLKNQFHKVIFPFVLLTCTDPAYIYSNLAYETSLSH